MRPFSETEIQNIVTEIDTQYLGAQLQEAFLRGTTLVLTMYQGGHFWLIFDLNDRHPALLLSTKSCPIAKSIEKKPVLLFLKAHGVGKKLSKVEMVQDEGRSLKLTFFETTVHFCMIPGFMNLTIKTPQAQISWNKPKALPIQGQPYIDASPRPWSQIFEEWQSARLRPRNAGVSPQVDDDAYRKNQIERKKEAIRKIQKVAESLDPQFFKNLGEKLKSVSSQVSSNEASWDSKGFLAAEIEQLDLSQSPSENMQRSFQKSYHLQTKIEGAQKQISKLQQEIIDLEAGIGSRSLLSKPKSKIKFQDADIKARKQELGGGLFVMTGKSGEDNLKLLRKARAWDLWFHLRDYPSTHAIIFKDKGQVISPEALDQALQFLGKEVVSKKTFVAGLVLEVVMTECRFVRPLKNEKPGRVTYTNAKTLYLRVNDGSA